MSKTKDNHYVAQWHQKGFNEDTADKLCHLKQKVITLKDGSTKIVPSRKWYTPAQCFYGEHLYSTFLGAIANDDVEKKLFGPIDDNGSVAIKAFLSDDQALWHHNFEDFFTYLDAQKIRTPKGLGWIKSKYADLNQIELMVEMQALRTLNRTLWTEGVREFVSAKDSDVKFILSDHPVAVYNYAFEPETDECVYPNDPDIALKGTQTIFPLDKNRCLILTNLEYAQDSDGVDPTEQRTNATKTRTSLVNTINFINSRKLTSDEVTKINHIIKSRAGNACAAGKEEWLYPEKSIDCDWAELRHVLLPPDNELHHFGGEMYVQYKSGRTHYQDAFGRSTPQSEHLKKQTDESILGKNELCGCGSEFKYKRCCQGVPVELRASWTEVSIRERNLAFCRAIKSILGLKDGKNWMDVRREITDEQVAEIYTVYSHLWPVDTDIYSLLPKPDGKHRALYSGFLDTRILGTIAIPTASLFDEFLIQSPIMNPNNVKPEFNPIHSPSSFKYQAVKDFSMILELEPYIGTGLINLIPDPSNFNQAMILEVLDMATSRRGEVQSARDYKVILRCGIEDMLNSMNMLPRELKIRTIVQEFGVPEEMATEIVDAIEANAESSSLTMLQSLKLNSSDGGQFMSFSIGPNYEMALFIAQVTGSVIVTDSESRWIEFQKSQHTEQGFPSYPWHGAHSKLKSLPIDFEMIDSLKKSQGLFQQTRSLLKSMDGLVRSDNSDADAIKRLSTQIESLDEKFKERTERYPIAYAKVLSPKGGFYDNNVQRLIARSSSLRHDRSVRTIYYLGYGLDE